MTQDPVITQPESIVELLDKSFAGLVTHLEAIPLTEWTRGICADYVRAQGFILYPSGAIYANNPGSDYSPRFETAPSNGGRPTSTFQIRMRELYQRIKAVHPDFAEKVEA